MIEVRAENLDKVAKRFKDFPASLKGDLEKWLTWACAVVLRESKILASGKILRVRTGKFRASITSQVNKEALTGIVGTKHPGAQLLEFGGTVTAKKAKFLAIPFPGGEAETKAGAMRKPRDYKGTFIVKTATGLVIMGSRGDKRAAAPLFTLRRSAKIPAKHLFQATQDLTFPMIGDHANMVVKACVDRQLSD